jgi:hypothetical protein
MDRQYEKYRKMSNFGSIAVVAEWLRRLTRKLEKLRNQIPSGSVGSNPTNCGKILNYSFALVFIANIPEH